MKYIITAGKSREGKRVLYHKRHGFQMNHKTEYKTLRGARMAQMHLLNGLPLDVKYLIKVEKDI